MVSPAYSDQFSQLLKLILVSNADSVQNTLTQVVKEFGKIDIFVANAGKLSFAARKWILLAIADILWQEWQSPSPS